MAIMSSRIGGYPMTYLHNWSPPPNSSIKMRGGGRLRCRRLLIETPPVTVEQQVSPSQSVARRLILLRHAKSSWEYPSLRDHDRPLSKAGQADAVQVSKKLQQLGWIPQLILTSDAVRTRETLKIMQEHVQGFLEAEIHFISSFYSVAAMDGQTADHLQHAICKYSTDEILTVMCMGHNRGWEEAASMFTGSFIELKTCNAALLEAAGKTWEEAFAIAGLEKRRRRERHQPHEMQSAILILVETCNSNMQKLEA
ncbi:hypothetical protein LWI29_022229 [Acer saccharum]|uniref:Uncharacterized protein n=1 Tax=Acer saccharum TaxID=4024 RepID=A0AA39VS95_ACESA|nr:hypothetical protein LWI29_022229 [Acer saccharum]